MTPSLRFRRMVTRDVSVTDAAVEADQQELERAIDCFESLQKLRRTAAKLQAHQTQQAIDGVDIHVDVSVNGSTRHCAVNFVTAHNTGDSTVLLYNVDDDTFMLAYRRGSSGLYEFVPAFAREVSCDDDDDMPPWKVITTLTGLLSES